MSDRSRILPKASSAPPSPSHKSAPHGEPKRRISYAFGQDPPATQFPPFTLPTGTDTVPELAEYRESDPVHEEDWHSHTPSCQQRSEASLRIASASQDSDLQSTSERGQLYNSQLSIDTGFPVNGSCFRVSAPSQQASETSLRTVSASQSSDLQSSSENGQHRNIGTDFLVNCVPVSALAQPSHLRQDGVVTGSGLPLISENINTDDIRRQHRENCNERAFKANNLHSDLSQM